MAGWTRAYFQVQDDLINVQSMRTNLHKRDAKWLNTYFHSIFYCLCGQSSRHSTIDPFNDLPINHSNISPPPLSVHLQEPPSPYFSLTPQSCSLSHPLSNQQRATENMTIISSGVHIIMVHKSTPMDFVLAESIAVRGLWFQAFRYTPARVSNRWPQP